jgi:nitroreductase
MEFNKCIKKRYSVRKYKDKKVSESKIIEIIDAGRHAPNSGNLQNWRFVVINEDKIKEKISKVCSNQTWMNQAPVFIAICSDESEVKRHFGKNATKFSEQNCAAATQNMLLKSCDLGLGTCWIGGFDSEKIKEILNIPAKDNLNVETIITIGYANEKKPTSEKYELKELVYFNEWLNKK